MNLLHLTDLHFSNQVAKESIEDAWQSIYETLLRIQIDTKIDGIVITGDITLNGAKDEFSMAYDFLDQLCKLTKISKKHFFICQGNHDADTKEKNSSFDHYQEFVKNFLGNERGDSIQTSQAQYGILSINTCTQTSWEMYNHGILLEEEVERVRNESKRFDYTIVLMHHQSEIIANSALLSEWKGKVHLIISGHKHPNYASNYIFAGIENVNGMAVTPHLPNIPRGYQVLKIEHGSVETIITRSVDC